MLPEFGKTPAGTIPTPNSRPSYGAAGFALASIVSLNSLPCASRKLPKFLIPHGNGFNSFPRGYTIPTQRFSSSFPMSPQVPDPSSLQRENESLGSSIHPFSPSFPSICWEIQSREQPKGQQGKELHSWFIFLPFLRPLGIDGLTEWQISAFPQPPSLFGTETSQKIPNSLFFLITPHTRWENRRGKVQETGAGLETGLEIRDSFVEDALGGEKVNSQGFFVPPRQ